MGRVNSVAFSLEDMFSVSQRASKMGGGFVRCGVGVFPLGLTITLKIPLDFLLGHGSIPWFTWLGITGLCQYSGPRCEPEIRASLVSGDRERQLSSEFQN